MNTTWTVKITIDEIWIEDGFELTEEIIKQALLTYSLGYATDDEVIVKIVGKK